MPPTHRFEIRLTEQEHDVEQTAAAIRGETLSEFVRRAARNEAERPSVSGGCPKSPGKRPLPELRDIQPNAHLIDERFQYDRPMTRRRVVLHTHKSRRLLAKQLDQLS